MENHYIMLLTKMVNMTIIYTVVIVIISVMLAFSSKHRCVELQPDQAAVMTVDRPVLVLCQASLDLLSEHT